MEGATTSINSTVGIVCILCNSQKAFENRWFALQIRKLTYNYQAWQVNYDKTFYFQKDAIGLAIFDIYQLQITNLIKKIWLKIAENDCPSMSFLPQPLHECHFISVPDSIAKQVKNMFWVY